MRSHTATILGAACVTLLAACASGSGTPTDGLPSVALQRVVAGLDFPVYLTAPPNDARLFVVEKTGRIRVVKQGALQAAPFLDLSSLVSGGSEQGLLGLAFHPQYAANGRLFVDYTGTDGNTRVAEYHAGTDPDRADSTSGNVLLTVTQPYSNHNGGQLAFGPGGKLYISLGDGGSGGDPQGHGQNAGDLLGSLLRIDVDGAAPYAIPPDNPWADSTGARSELWNIGLRNPWRFSFDRATGDLYIGDVGQGAFEEVDVGTAASGGGRGANYGWNIMEGLSCYGASSCDKSGLTLPVVQYTHQDGCSITGGYVYRGSAIPELAGHYFYADYCEGWVRSFRFSNGTATDQRSWSTLAPGGNIPSFGQDAAGELYVLDASGTVSRIVKRAP